MSQRNTTARTIALPTGVDFQKSLTIAAENCGALCGVKGPAAKIIPPGIRTQMRALTRLDQYWAKNRSAYNVLLEASQNTATAARAHRAGA